jgi:capsular polysaccharide transport system permease protein
MPPAAPPPAARRPPLRHAALRSIAALMLREMSTRFGRTPGGYIWILVQPLAVIILLALGFSLLQTNPPLGTSFLLFKATGYMILVHFRQITTMVGHSLQFSRPLLDYPGVLWIDAVLARFLINALTTVLVTWIVLQGMILYEGLTPTLRWPLILQAMGLSLGLAAGIGCLNAVLFLRFEVWVQAWNILTAPLFIVSGVILLYEDMPAAAQELLWWNPVMHVTGLMRAGFYSTYTPAYVSVPFVLACALVPMALGLLLLRRWHRVLLER